MVPKPADSESAAAIEMRIEAAKSAREPSRPQGGAAGQAHMAWRMVADLVAGIGIGAICGYGLDALFGSTPAMLVAMTLLGFAAGVNLMLRTARSADAGSRREAGRAAAPEERR